MSNTKRYIRLYFMFLLIAVEISIFVYHILLIIRYLINIIIGLIAKKIFILKWLKGSIKEIKRLKNHSYFLSIKLHYCNTYTLYKSPINSNKTVNFYSKTKQQLTSLIAFRQTSNFYIPLHSGSFM
jgi:hypothetical protein